MREPRFYETPSCATVGGDFWFPEKEKGGLSNTDIRTAKSICGSCIHKSECAEWGIAKETYGIWGGLTADDRKYIRRQKRISIEEEDVA
jgi:hypothetical protein